MRLANYLGKSVSYLLGAEPFKSWPVERLVDDDSDPPTVGYIFVDCGFQLNCDSGNERVRSLFLEKESHAGIVMSELSFSLPREKVLSYFGSPSKSGESFSDPVLGDFGAWDRFQRSDYTVHIQYKIGSDGIEKITLMRNDVAP